MAGKPPDERDEPPTGRDEDTGRFTTSIDADVALDAFGDRDDDCEPLSAKEVAERTDLAERTAHTKLKDLVDEGMLQTKTVGRNRVYWVAQPHLESFRNSSHYEQDEQDDDPDPANPGDN